MVIEIFPKLGFIQNVGLPGLLVAALIFALVVYYLVRMIMKR